jgi:phosphoribosylanthranilate isomerase
VLIKICGTTSEDDALLAVALGADAVGFVLAPSPRQVRPSLVADIVKRLPRQEILTVGVFRDEVPARVVEIATSTGLDAVQLHGHESPEEARWIRQRVPRIFKAFPAGHVDVSRAAEWGADAVLLDAPSPGSGTLFDWALAGELPQGQHLIVAGGLDPENVAAAVSSTRPWGVDVASGVEAAPGRKDPMKLKAFIDRPAEHGPGRGAGSGSGPGWGPGSDTGFGARPGSAPGVDPFDDDEPYDWQEDR